MWLHTITILITFVSLGRGQEDKIVTITQGPVRGYKALNREIYEFYEIPYATAPTGTDKFKAPLPAPTWTDTLDAVQNNIVCPHIPIFANSFNATENCLVANVFVPTNTQATNLSVVVYIHGGGYFEGHGMADSPKPLVESQRLVAVTFNYRLGVHGFLCLGTEDVPGNAGLKDMVAALRWVKENIAQFGGNPDDVTLAGYSAGASAADLLSLSKAAEGLFSKLILESGAHVAAFSVQLDPIKNAQDYARTLNFDDVGRLTALEEFYKTASYELLFSNALLVLLNYNFNLVFVPCIENDIGQERILDDSPMNILKNSEHVKLPALYGFSNMEGRMRMPLFDSWAPEMNKKFSEFLVLDLQFEDDNEKEEVALRIKEFYFGSNTVGLYTLFDYINYYTDVMFAGPILRSVKLQVEAGNEQIFLYEYTFYNKYVPVPGVLDILTNFPGADHCEQTYAVLEHNRFNEENFTEEYKQIRENLRELWINFVTSGTPVPENSSFPEWPPVTASNGSPHMILGDTFELGGALIQDRAELWDEIYDKYYQHPLPPTFEGSNQENNAHILSGGIIGNLVFICVIYFVSC